MFENEQINWSEYSLVEIKPQAQSWAPVLRGTRLPVSTIVDNHAYGLTAEEISAQFQVPQEQVEAILAYAKSHRVAHPA